MTDSLDLSVPKPGERPEPPRRGHGWLLALILAGVAAQLILTVTRDGLRHEGGGAAAGGLSGEARKELALKLEQEGLSGAAVEAWKDYVAMAARKPDEAARIWYRIGTLLQDRHENEAALAAYYRSERLCKVEGLAPEIARRTAECLESQGKFAALRHSVAERVNVGTATNDEVLAEIGPQKITRSDLDRQIEREIERFLAASASGLPDEDARRQKAEMLKRLSTGEARARALNQFLLEELLYRKARESGLTDDPAVRDLLRAQERSLLAQQLMEKEVRDAIKITPSDLRTWYEANRAEFVQPERARIARIAAKDEAGAEAIRARLEKGEDFEKVAAELAAPEGGKGAGGGAPDWVEKGEGAPGLGDAAVVDPVVFATAAGHVAEKPLATPRGVFVIKVLEREAERQKAFEEVAGEVQRRLRAQKEREVHERLLSELRDRYDVVVHAGALGMGSEKPEAGSGGK